MISNSLMRTTSICAVLLSSAVTPVYAEGTFFKPVKEELPPAKTVKPVAPPKPNPAETGQPQTPTASPAESAAAPTSYPQELSGRPQIVDTANLSVQGHRVLLAGLDGLSGQYAASLQGFVSANGNSVLCSLVGAGPYYRCMTSLNRIDVANAALLNGAARTSAAATPAQRAQEEQAKSAGRGIWAGTSQ